MPIGKNALKRVSNNGYSKVNTSAPDMEHSEVAEPEVKAVEKPAVKKAAPKTAAKSAPKSTPKTAPKTAPKAEKKPTAKPEADNRPDGFVRFELGDDMPVHLL